ncbi:Cysteine synthase B [Alphaproteobacteria bacterium SO-S41]|nr:Cysteine synthase B [Alphaproteobacteria bacterium SO-S41]
MSHAPLDEIAHPEVDRAWLTRAVGAIEADANRSADTHLVKLPMPERAGIDIYLKDESSHPSGSLKHRLARSLFLYGLCNGWIRPDRPVIEASSGSTAISEAYFAQLIGVPFVAVVPVGTAQAKLDAIRAYGGTVQTERCANTVVAACRKLAAYTGGIFLDQFTNAERATDWRGNNNIAESLFAQMAREPHPLPAWIVVGAGTGGTSATVGRYIRYNPRIVTHTRLCVVDPLGSAIYDQYQSGAALHRDFRSPVEGIGRPDVPGSFIPSVVDRMIAVPDTASIAAMLWLEKKLRRRCGPSTGTNIVGVMHLAQEMSAQGRTGSIVTLICDGGERYGDTVYAPRWRTENGIGSDALAAAWTA